MVRQFAVRQFATVATLALVLGGCGQKDTAAPADATASETAAVAPVDTPAVAVAMSGQDFANGAAAGDAFEIASSQLAATNAQSARVKTFASQMIKAHTESTAKLKTAASAASPAITPNPAMKPEQQQMLATLKGKTGAEFDTAYVAAQVTAHQQTLALLNQYVDQGTVPPLKAFAEGLIPIVTAHLNMVTGMKP